MEAWERVYMEDPESFLDTVHGHVGCINCHGGTNSPDMEIAHEGMVRDPSNDNCETCHPNIGPYQHDTLHYSLAGYDTDLYARAGQENAELIEHIEEMQCESCHTTCGQCHVSRPETNDGGFLEGHMFVRTPPMRYTCTGCHGSRIQNEYSGRNEGYPSDVHYRNRMGCSSCHTGDEMHFTPDGVAHRYDGEQTPSCESCHEEDGVGVGIEMHDQHWGDMSCQVCHSVAYTNCVGCHVYETDDGRPYFSVDDHFMDFRIGRNPRRSPERPYAYVTVRHVPIAPDSFAFYGLDTLPYYSALETWHYATPHNIQRVAPQAESCDSCHGNEDIFLTEDVVAPEEREANADVIVEEIPSLDLLPEEYRQAEEPAEAGEAEGAAEGSED